MSPLVKSLSSVLVAVLAISAHGNGHRPFFGKVVYKNAKTMSELVLDDGYVIAGPVIRRSDSKNIFAGERLGTAATDCSNSTYRCIEFVPYVFAVPRKMPGDHDQYRVRGTIFSISSCLRQHAGRCDAALIEANCVARDIKHGICLPSATNNTPDGPKAYFIYDAALGVVSLGFADTSIAQSEQLGLAKNYLLKGRCGMLCP